MGYAAGSGGGGEDEEPSIFWASRENRKNISPAVFVALRMLAWTASPEEVTLNM